MGFKKPAVFAIAALICAGVGVIFQVVGVATPVWLTASVGDFEQGLWKVCTNGQCSNYGSNIEDWVKACQAFGILGVLVLVGCLVVGALQCFVENVMFNLIAAILGFVAALCILIEFAVFVGNAPTGVDYGYSFVLTVLAFLLALAAGVLFLVAKVKA